MASTWGNSWGGETGSWLTSWSGTFVPPVPQDKPYPGPAGKAKKRREPTKIVVEIDGKLHAVNSAEQAQELLESVRNKVQETTIKAVAKAIAKPAVEYKPEPAPVVEVRGKGETAQHVQAQVDQFRANVQAVQMEALRRYAEAMAELDDEEAIIALL